MWEPRGHADMYGGIVLPPLSEGSDLGVLFTHNEGFSTMCGHGIIALATVAAEVGLATPTSPETMIRIDTPAGHVRAYARHAGARVRSVRFHNVPSFVVELDQTVHVPELGSVRFDLAFGGAFYAYVDVHEVGERCAPDRVRHLIDKGMAIKRAVTASRPIVHPVEPDLGFLYGTIFIDRPEDSTAHSRNVCIFADGEVDRSPTGTGVSGRLAIHHARNEIRTGESIVIESIIGTRFRGAVVETTTFGPYEAVVPEVEGSAHITGRCEFLIDPEDPLKDGFLLG